MTVTKIKLLLALTTIAAVAAKFHMHVGLHSGG